VTDILDELSWRGLIHQSTDEAALREALTIRPGRQPPMLYCGFDPTAASLHVGNLVPLLTLRRFQLAGYRPIALAGGATGRIGDPSGRSSERALQTDDVVSEYLGRIRAQLERFLDFDAADNAATVVDNLEWTGPLSAIAFLRDIGKHFSVNVMLGKESIRARLEGGGISYTEFSYMLLQANDFLELFRRGCVLQIGGSDQWGNIIAGVDLIRRVTAEAAHGLTLPLVTTATGQKFGKSTGGGNLWLDPVLTSPYAFYQYWINTDDRDVEPYLRYFSFLGREEIEALAATTRERPQARVGQRRLATELTTLVHGAEETRRVEAASEALFGRGVLEDLDEPTLGSALAEVPHVDVGPGELPAILDLLTGTGLCASRSEARRQVQQGGVYLNNVRITDAEQPPAPESLLHGRYLVLRRGRKAVAGVLRSG
jgi:tyrosyl-tRNA synthetase